VNLTLRQGILKMRLAAIAALAFVVLLGLGVAATPAQAQTFTTLYNFTGWPDGASPYAGLIADAKGNLYGTTFVGGEWNYGAVFEMAKTSTGYAAPEILYSFTGQADGAYPLAGLLLIGGDLYGTTENGGTGGTTSPGCFDNVIGCGTVFELVPPAATSGTWTETVLYNFTGGNDGAQPLAGLIADKKGNLYGTASAGGPAANFSSGDSGAGVVFELVKGTKIVAKKKETTWTDQTLYAFQYGNGTNVTDGSRPVAPLIMDKEGNLYGTTSSGGYSPNGYSHSGTVFELTPPATTAGAWSEQLLYTFCTEGGYSCTDGQDPYAGLVMDSKGNLYGTTEYGGANVNPGTAFELEKTSTGYTETVLHSFTGNADGGTPLAGLVLKGSALYGTTAYGGDMSCTNMQGWNGCGTVFELSGKTVKGKTTYTDKVLYAFQETTNTTGNPGDGESPLGGLVMDKAGNLYGTTSYDDYYGAGTVFEVTP
jgi:uncharacterized repeat protein (TIGR03803 family)